METRSIGQLQVSVVGLGCNNFGGRIDYDATVAVIDAALDAGITLFDTADVYGGNGKSEEFIGKALQGRRDKVILATKFGSKMEAGEGAKADYIRIAVEDSLRRLNTDVIDLYQLHWPDASTPIEETLGALDELVKAGKVREIGCSNFSVPMLQEAEAVSQRTGGALFKSVQNHYSMLKRDPENDGVLAECERQGLGFLPYFPLERGLLTGKFRKGEDVPQGTRLSKQPDQLTDDRLDVVEKLIEFAESRGHTVLELAFSWLLSRPAVSSVIAGATKPEQIQANVAAVNWSLRDADLQEIDTLLAEVPAQQ
jgi:aryl-alcohol dehydrogenase-like predicted oxidoreductase